MKRWIAVCLLLIAVAAVFVRRDREPVGAEPSASRSLAIVLTDDWDAASGAPNPMALMPVRDGGPGHDFVDVLRTGSRSRPAPGAISLGAALKRAKIPTLAIGPKAARLLEVEDQKGQSQVLARAVCLALDLSAPEAKSTLARIRRLEPAVEIVWIRTEITSAERAHGERLVPIAWESSAQNAGARVSASTGNRVGIVAATDFAATVLAILRVETRDRIGAGRPMRRIDAVFDWRDALARSAAQSREQRRLPTVAWVLAIATVLAATFSARAPRTSFAIFAALAAFPLGLLLAPGLASDLSVFALASLLALSIGLASWRWGARVFVGLAVVVVFVYACDLLFGEILLSRSPFSYSVAEAARFHGIGNEGGGYLLGASFFLAFRWRGFDGFCVGLAAFVWLGVPWLGANVGCALASLAGLAFLGALSVPDRLRWRALVFGLVLALTAACALAFLDSRRGAGARGHLGEAILSGPASLLDLAGRKAAMNARLTVTSPWALLLLARVGVFVWRSRRESGSELGLPVVLLGAYLMNDSGVVASAIGGLWLGACEKKTADAGAPAANKTQ